MPKPLLESEALELLGDETVGHLACLVNGEPYVVPINYVADGELIYSHSMQGVKINALRANPRLCLQVEQIKSPFSWRSAQVFGDFEEIQSPSERRYVLSRLLDRFPLLTPVESLEGSSEGDCVVFRVAVDRIVGVKEDLKEVDHEEPHRPESVDWISDRVQ